MKLTCLILSCLLTVVSFAQDAPAPKKEEPADSKKKPSQEELEARFIKTMTNATMSGRWCLIKDGALTPEKEDKYTIVSVKKNDNGFWTVNSRIEYGGFNMVVPVPLRVEWADDTPVMVVNKMGIPGGNKYSARVLVFENSYAGTWSGPGIQGLLNGMITHEPTEEKEASESKEKAEETPKDKKEDK